MRMIQCAIGPLLTASHSLSLTNYHLHSSCHEVASPNCTLKRQWHIEKCLVLDFSVHSLRLRSPAVLQILADENADSVCTS